MRGAINPDLTVRDVRVQRARDPALLQEDVVSRLKATVIGKDVAQLRKDYKSRGLESGRVEKSDFFGSMLRSAIKTLSVTSVAVVGRNFRGSPSVVGQAHVPNHGTTRGCRESLR